MNTEQRASLINLKSAVEFQQKAEADARALEVGASRDAYEWIIEASKRVVQAFEVEV